VDGAPVHTAPRHALVIATAPPVDPRLEPGKIDVTGRTKQRQALARIIEPQVRSKIQTADGGISVAGDTQRSEQTDSGG
jgi:hypothetical protein